MVKVLSEKARRRIAAAVQKVENSHKGRALPRRAFPLGVKRETVKFCKGGAHGDIVAGSTSNTVDIWHLDNGSMVDSGDDLNDVHFVWIHRDGDGVLQNISSDRMVRIELIGGDWHVVGAQCEESTP